MSFSFSVRSKRLDGAYAAAIGAVCSNTSEQPGHDADRHVVNAAIHGAVYALAEPGPDQMVEATGYGHCSGGYAEGIPVTQVEFHVKASLVPDPAYQVPKPQGTGQPEQPGASDAGADPQVQDLGDASAGQVQQA